MGMDIALQEAPRRGKDGIKLHRVLLHSGGRDIRQRSIDCLACLPEGRDFLICLDQATGQRLYAWPVRGAGRETPRNHDKT
jgi:hypothetical protein